GIRPGVHKCAHSLVARRIADGNFQELGCRSALDSINANTVPPFVLETHGSEIRNAIRRNVLARITHLINQLFFDSGNNYPAAGAFMFRNNKGAIGRCFDNWKTYSCEIGDAAPLVLAVSAGSLRAAFDNMAGDGAGSQPIPIVYGPAKLVNHR